MRTRTWGSAVTIALIVLTGPSISALPVGNVRGSHNGALVSFEPHRSLAVYMSASAWGTTGYGGIPPEELGGLGDLEFCLGVYTPYEDHGEVWANGCSSDIVFEVDRLRSAHIEATLNAEFSQGDGTIVGVHAIVVDVRLVGRGLAYPGVAARTNASPGMELELSWQRSATVSGTVSSEAFGTIDVAPAQGVLFADECRAMMFGPDYSETCRF